MIRRVIEINEDKCNGCGICISACHEGAIGLIDGKAKLLRDDYCDGLGNCLPACPTEAISFIEREADAFDEEAVKANMENKQPENLACGCPGTQSKTLVRQSIESNPIKSDNNVPSQLNQWPVQIKLVPINAPYFRNANLLVAADCSAFAYGNFHSDFMKNKVTIIGCPKLDEGDYSDKLTAILLNNDIKSLTVVRMEVPCCAGIANAAITALKNCGKMIPWNVVTISTNGEIIEN